MSNQPHDPTVDPDLGAMQESLDEVAQRVEGDPDLAAELRGVLRHLGETPIDPTGAPE